MPNEFLSGIIGAWRVKLLTPYCKLIVKLLTRYIEECDECRIDYSLREYQDAHRILAIFKGLKR